MLRRSDEAQPGAGEEAQQSAVRLRSLAYSEIGDRVAGVLRAAEEAAEQIRGDARQEAEGIRRQAEADAAARVQELTREAERVRGEAEDYARDIRLAVESYASERRREAEEEARRLLADAEAEARAIREAAQEMAQQIEDAARKRQENLREEARSFEERRQRALEGLRDIVAQLQDVIVEPQAQRPGEQSLVDALNVERHR